MEGQIVVHRFLFNITMDAPHTAIWERHLNTIELFHYVFCGAL